MVVFFWTELQVKAQPQQNPFKNFIKKQFDGNDLNKQLNCMKMLVFTQDPEQWPDSSSIHSEAPCFFSFHKASLFSRSSTISSFTLNSNYFNKIEQYHKTDELH